MSVVEELLARVQPDRIVEMTKAITRLSVPDGSEGPRARAIGELLAHPRIDVHIDPALPGRPNVIARVRGTGGPDARGLLLNGHIDAGYVADGWRHDPLDPWVESERIYGGAVSDMLGGVASMMEALLVAAEGPELPGDLVLLGNMHHDSNGLGTKYALASEDGWPRYGINGEPTSNSILTTHGGCVKFEIELRGRVAHISRAAEGVDALAAAVRVYERLSQVRFTHDADPDLPILPRLLLGQLEGGFAPAAVAPLAVVKGDLRTVPGMTWATVRADVEAAVAGVVPEGVVARVNCIVHQRSFVGSRTTPLFDALSAAHQAVTGTVVAVNVETASQTFVTDAVDMAHAGIETLVYGPGEWHYEPNESIAIAELSDATRTYLATATRLMSVE